MSEPTLEGVVAPIFLAVVITLLSFFVKAILSAHGFKRAMPIRGFELFRLCFVGPDLAFFFFFLFVSSQALQSLLDGYKVSTNYGEQFHTYFWVATFCIFLALLFSVFLWIIHEDNERQFIVTKRSETRRERDGSETTGQVYDVNLWASVSSWSGFLILVLGNLVGFASIISYVVFMYFGFISKSQ